jgi:ABC-2 type transport system ATP-binding protein
MAFLRLRDLWVEFPIYQGSSRSLKKSLLAKAHGNLARDARDRVNVVALSDLNLDIEHGDRLAVWGPTAPARARY